MKISAIQTNYLNRMSFKNNETKPETSNPSEKQNEGMSKDTKIALGVGSGVIALAALAYAGYHGHLGSGIQKLLGGAKDAAKNLSKDSDINIKKPKTSEVSIPGKGSETPEIKPEINTDAPEIKPAGEITQKSTGEISEIKTPTKTDPETTEVSAPNKGSETPDIKPEVNTETQVTAEPHKFLSAEEAKNLSYSEQTTRVMADIEAIEKESPSLEDAFTNIDKYMNELGEASVISDKNIDLIEAVAEKMISKYSEVISKQKSGIAMPYIKSTLAQIKLAKQQYPSAEKLALEIINDKGASMKQVKIDAFGTLFEASEALGKKASAEEIFDKEVQQVLNELNLLRAQNKKVEEVPVWGYLQNIYEKLAQVYGENNPTIKAAAQAIN